MNLYERIQTWLGSQGEAGDRVSEYLSFLNQDLLAGDPSAEDFMQQLSADQVLSWLDDEQLAPDVLALLTPLSGYIRDLGEVKWWYVVEVEGFLESTCHGPFVSEEEVVRVAQGIYEQQEPTRDGLFWDRPRRHAGHGRVRYGRRWGATGPDRQPPPAEPGRRGADHSPRAGRARDRIDGYRSW